MSNMAALSQTKDIPIANRPTTILACSITVQALALVAVALRLYARSQIKKALGADDVLVVLACLISGVGSVFVDLQPGAGLGKHQYLLTLPQFEQFLVYSFGALVAYTISTTLIKLSILWQYSRLAHRESRVFRWMCIGMMIAVTMWGLAFLFLTVFSCVPVSSFWDLLHPGKCILYGSDNHPAKVKTYLTHASTNMLLDVIVFAMPIYLVRSMNLSQRNKLGLLGVFSLGALVVVISILRLTTIATHQLGLTTDPMDATWFSPQPIIWSCIEVNIAVICASIPIFWPMIASVTLGKIFITKEFEVTSDLARASRIYTFERFDDEQELTGITNYGKPYIMNSTKCIA